jgi:hypothetical protein
MNRSQLNGLSTDDLVDRFVSIALLQHEAVWSGDSSAYNKLYGTMMIVEELLKNSADDQRRRLLPLLKHENPMVRLKAAIATLAIDREAARATLKGIWDRKEHPEAADALGILNALDEGRYLPS